MKTKSAISVLVFGLYMLIQGSVLMIAPAILLNMIAVPVPMDAWVRVTGWCLVVLGIYYVQAARHSFRPFFLWSGWVRVAQFGFFLALWFGGLIQPILLGFSAVELASGVWTLVALRESSMNP